MILRLSQAALMFALLLAPQLVLAEERETRSFALPGHGGIQLDVPRSWASKVAQPADGLPPTITFTPQGAPSFRVMVTPLWSGRPDAALPGPAEVKRLAERFAEEVRGQSVENELPVRELKGRSAAGYFFAATDRAPKPGEFKFMTQGVLRLDDLLVTFTALANDDSKSVGLETVAILANAVRSKAQSSQPAAAVPARRDAIQFSERANDYLLTVPMSRLAMTVPKGGLARKSPSIGGSTGNPRYFYFEDSASQLIVSGWFEPEGEFPGAGNVWSRDTRAWRKRGLPEPRDVQFTKIGHWDAVVYDMDVPGATNANIRAHWVEGGTWIDVHLSVTTTQPSRDARSRLESALRGISVTKKD